MGLVGDDSVVYYLDLVNRMRGPLKTAFSGMQRELNSQYRVQLSAEDQVTAQETARKRVMYESLNTQRLLTRELEKQGKVTATTASMDTKGRWRARNFQELKDTYLTMEGLKSRTLSLFGGQIGSLMMYYGALQVVTGGLKMVVGGQADLQEQAQRVAIVLEGSSVQMQQDLGGLTQAAREWSLAHGTAAKDILGSMYELGAAGRTAVQIQKEFRSAGLLAEGGLIKEAAAVEVLTSQVNTFARDGLTAAHTADILQKVAQVTQGQVADLAEAMKYSSASAVTMNVSFEKQAALLGTLANLGLRGSMAGTGLNRVFVALAEKQGLIREIGIEVEDASGRMRDFIDILADFRRVFGTEIGAREKALLERLFDMRGARVMERLLSDATTLDKVMKDLEAAEGAAMEAAERRSDTLKESWKVLWNQVQNMALGEGKVAKDLQHLFDAISNRKAERALQNLQAGSSGVMFEIERLNEMMQKGDDVSRDWARALLKAAENLQGPLGERLRSLQEQYGQVPMPPVWTLITMEAFWTPTDQARAANMWARYLAQFTHVLEKHPVKGRIMLQAILEEERLRQMTAEEAERARQIVKTVFGQEPFDVTLELAIALSEGDLPRAAVQAWLDDQVLEYQFVPDMREFWKGQAEAHRAGAKDPAVMLELKDWQKMVGETDLEILRTRLEIVEAGTRQSVEAREEAARLELQINKKQVDAERAKAKTAFDDKAKLASKDVDTQKLMAAEKKKIEDEFRLKNVAAQTKYTTKMAALSWERLEAEYGGMRKIRDLEWELRIGRADVGLRPGMEREADIEDFSRRQQIALEKLKAGTIDFTEYQNEQDSMQAQFAVNEMRRDEAARKRQLTLLQLGQEAALAEARQLVIRATGLDRFEAERILKAKELKDEEDRLRLQYVDDEKRGILEIQNARDKSREWNIQNDLAEGAFRRQLMLDEVSAAGEAFAGIGELVAAMSNEARGKLLADLAMVTAAASQVIEVVEAIKLTTMSLTGGTFAIVGIIAGAAARLFGQRREAEREVRELTDEFRHQEGRNVSAEFGKAQVYNVRIEQNNSIDFLAAPTQAQIRSLLWQIKDPLVRLLEEMGFDSGGGA